MMPKTVALSVSKWIRIFVFPLLLLPIFSFSQSSPQFFLQISSGADIGWWIYDKGQTDTLPTIHRGYDRTHLAAIYPIEIEAGIKAQRWTFAAGYSRRTLEDNVMIGSDHRRGDRNKYKIIQDKSYIPLHTYHAQAAYSLVQKRRFSMGFQLRVGGFSLTHDHPRKAYFHHQWMYETALPIYLDISRQLQFMFRPRYAQLNISTKGSTYNGEKHGIYSVGATGGLRFIWNNKRKER